MGIADDAKNKAEDFKGRGKEAAGSLTGDEDLKAEGQKDQGVAAVKDAVTGAADKAKGVVDDIKDALTDRKQ